ncbi:MAG: hypothetical protein LBH62_03060 [Nitrososphaerota archaeon]|jgi:membrane protein YdbS with pleckstrin-like domain|uniref:hypothetical protein n=1 Tax=Candidatus Bathycorpusculum sp. TaxID=2994959 RepID=UPI00282E569E|nr:hypothetical protein [Candidatus Termiticorpusculum sp.]MCL2256654.1 hypothetical protein [Candidatus Termiticorpusculum sp.]MCL2292807.1 hypothetical protein [Candidatus Termiticorpusculum sp.]MDR0460406.1 hypothetical protein [Nitrososphaerota archaeon]
MGDQINKEQINYQMNQLKKLSENTTTPAVSMYIIMSLRQIVKVLVLNEHYRFKVWRVNKAIECLRTATQLLQCTREEKSDLIAIMWQLEKSLVL